MKKNTFEGVFSPFSISVSCGIKFQFSHLHLNGLTDEACWNQNRKACCPQISQQILNKILVDIEMDKPDCAFSDISVQQETIQELYAKKMDKKMCFVSAQDRKGLIVKSSCGGEKTQIWQL